MNDENIAELCDALDKIKDDSISKKLNISNDIFSSDWIADEYKTVTDMRNRGRPSHRNEYRIIKTLINARTEILAANKEHIQEFIPVCKIIKKIENSIKDIFQQENSIRDVCDAMEKLLSD